jgi:hypothetical protein
MSAILFSNQRKCYAKVKMVFQPATWSQFDCTLGMTLFTEWLNYQLFGGETRRKWRSFHQRHGGSSTTKNHSPSTSNHKPPYRCGSFRNRQRPFDKRHIRLLELELPFLPLNHMNIYGGRNHIIARAFSQKTHTLNGEAPRVGHQGPNNRFRSGQ